MIATFAQEVLEAMKRYENSTTKSMLWLRSTWPAGILLKTCFEHRPQPYLCAALQRLTGDVVDPSTYHSLAGWDCQHL